MIALTVVLALASTEPETAHFPFTGPTASLERLVVIAKACGYPTASISMLPYYGKQIVEIEVPVPLREGGRAGCVMTWIEKHRELAIAMVVSEQKAAEVRNYAIAKSKGATSGY
jgi:hypothetical protein